MKNVIMLQPKKAPHADVFAATSGHELIATLVTSKDGHASLVLAGVDRLMSATLYTGTWSRTPTRRRGWSLSGSS